MSLKLIILGVISYGWLCATNFAIGQEKVSPPPSKIDLPSDTTRTIPKIPEKLDTAKPDLELPDVVVYGADRTMRTAGQKQVAQPEPITLMQPESLHEPISTWFKRDTEKPFLAGTSGSIDRRTSLTFSGGGYTTILIDGVHFQKFPKGNYRLRGNMERSDGEFQNSRYSRGAVSGKVSYILSPRATGLAHINFGLDGYGLHGAMFDDLDRRTITGSLGGEVQYDIARLSDGKLGFELGGISLESDTLSKELSNTTDFWYKLNFGYIADISGVQIGIYGDFLRETLSIKDDTVSTENSFGQLGLEVEKQFSEHVTTSLGVKYQNATLNLENDKAAISPYARINFMPSAQWGLSLNIHTGLEYQPYSHWWNMNRYLKEQVTFIPQETKFGVESNIEFELVPNMKLRGTFSRRWIKNAWYWQKNNNDGLFELANLNDVRLTTFEIGVVGEVGARTRIQVSLASYSDHLNKDDHPLGNWGHFPYRPDMRIPARVSVQLLKDAYIEIEADVVGKRYSRIDSLETLPLFSRMEAKVSKGIGKHFTALLIARNLLDADYAIWQGYPQTGIHLLFGMRARF